MDINNLKSNEVKNESLQLVVEFKSETSKFSDFLNHLEFPVTAYNERGLERFSCLSLIQQKKIIQSLKIYAHFCECAVADGIDVKENSDQFLWWTLRQLQLVPGSDLLSYVKPGMSIEIYNLEGIQIFRTLNLFKHITYSLSELLSYEWWELFSRVPAIEEEMQKWVQATLAGEMGIRKTQLPPHEVFEILGSENKFSGIMKHHLFAPVKNKRGAVSAAVSVFSAYHSWDQIN